MILFFEIHVLANVPFLAINAAIPDFLIYKVFLRMLVIYLHLCIHLNYIVDNENFGGVDWIRKKASS